MEVGPLPAERPIPLHSIRAILQPRMVSSTPEGHGIYALVLELLNQGHTVLFAIRGTHVTKFVMTPAAGSVVGIVCQTQQIGRPLRGSSRTCVAYRCSPSGISKYTVTERLGGADRWKRAKFTAHEAEELRGVLIGYSRQLVRT